MQKKILGVGFGAIGAKNVLAMNVICLLMTGLLVSLAGGWCQRFFSCASSKLARFTQSSFNAFCSSGHTGLRVMLFIQIDDVKGVV